MYYYRLQINWVSLTIKKIHFRESTEATGGRQKFQEKVTAKKISY
jgi:hypothetical protein